MKIIHFILSLIFITTIAFANTALAVWIDDYRGVIGDNIKIGMSLTISGNDVSGEYFYHRWLKDIPVKGEIDGRNIILNELDNKGKIAAVFKGRFLEQAPEYSQESINREVIEGKWMRPDGSEVKPFRLIFEGSVGLVGQSRYSVAGFDDETAEDIAQNFKNAVLSRNKIGVAKFVEYPITVYIDGKETSIKNEDAFVAHFEKIFHDGFFDEIKNSVPHNMFAKSSGVMLGDKGEIWIGKRDGKAMIISINNF